MIYIGIITPILIALAAMYDALKKPDTTPLQRRLIPVFALLTLLTGGYSVYSTYTEKKILEPWAAMQALYAHAVDSWALVQEANQTKDSAKLDKVIEDFTKFSTDAMKSRAPSWFKSRVAALSITVDLWAISERHPESKPQEIIETYAREKLAGTPFEGRPDKLLAMLGFFRIQDFGPPHKVLLGYNPDGSLRMDESRLSKVYLLDRAHDFFTDLTGMSQ
jgi:hypothetical protein